MSPEALQQLADKLRAKLGAAAEDAGLSRFLAQAEEARRIWAKQEELKPTSPAKPGRRPSAGGGGASQGGAHADRGKPSSSTAQPPKAAAAGPAGVPAGAGAAGAAAVDDKPAEEVPSAQAELPGEPVNAEELLNKLFGLADTLTVEELRALAYRAGRSQEFVRSHLAKMRTSVRTSLQRMQSNTQRGKDSSHHHHHRKAGADASAAAAAEQQAAAERAAAAGEDATADRREEELAKLSKLLDSKGAIKVGQQGASAFVLLMQVRAQLRAQTVAFPS